MTMITKKFRKYGIENGGEMLVPSDYTHGQQMAYIYMREAGYGCRAAGEGFRSAVTGGIWQDQPYSVVTNIIENRRWAEGFERGSKVRELTA